MFSQKNKEIHQPFTQLQLNHKLLLNIYRKRKWNPGDSRARRKDEAVHEAVPRGRSNKAIELLSLPLDDLVEVTVHFIFRHKLHTHALPSRVATFLCQPNHLGIQGVTPLQIVQRKLKAKDIAHLKLAAFRFEIGPTLR
jgi:hypothetical protein